MRTMHLKQWIIILLFFVAQLSAHVVLDYPKGGETFAVSGTVEIQWHIAIQHNQENWDLYFSADGGANWEIIQLDLPVSQLSYAWTVPEVLTEQARIRIGMDNADLDYMDSSDNFAIQQESSVGMETDAPQHFVLYPNYPNPFNPATMISYRLSSPEDITLQIYNVSGDRVRSLVHEQQSVGVHHIQWDGHDDRGTPMPSGIYVYRVRAGHLIETRRMLLLR